MLDHLLFDFDGTLVNTNDIVIFGLKQSVLEVCGRMPSDGEIMNVLGRITPEQLEMLDLDHKHHKLLLERYFEIYAANNDRLVKPYPLVNETLAELRASGCKLAIISSKERSGIEDGLARFDMSGFFDVIIDANAVSHNKPHPESALNAIAALGGRVENSLLIGDSPYDMGCAHNAAIKSALVSWTIFPEERFVGIEPDYVLKSMSDLPEICRKG